MALTNHSGDPLADRRPNRVFTRYKGRKVHRFWVTCIESGQLDRPDHLLFADYVTAHTAADAADFVRDLFPDVPLTTTRTTGPRGGIIERFVGWESAIGSAMFGPRPTSHQLTLPAVTS